MFYLPSLRRLLLPAFVLLAMVVFYRSSLHVPETLPHLAVYQPPPRQGQRLPIGGLPLLNASLNHLSPPQHYYYASNKGSLSKVENGSEPKISASRPVLNPHLEVLFRCPNVPNKITNHLRLPHVIRNISLGPLDSSRKEHREFWNPTIMSLPFWSKSQYLIVSRIVTDGHHQQNVLCEANICYPAHLGPQAEGESKCSADDLVHLGPAGGMRCTSDLILLSVPPTPAEDCTGKYGLYVDIPGFHDPRIFWSGKGEPLMMVNTQ